MCEYISWIPKKKGNYFLTYHQVFETEKGQQLRDKLKGDWYGHSGIKFYYDLVDTDESSYLQKECTDFSTPDNFPADIVMAIKAGEMGGYLKDNLFVLLSEDGIGAYSLECPSYADLNKAYADWKKADADRNKADADWNKAYADWNKADALGKIFWKVFSNPLNRIEVWR
jgi:hypothetical protein